MRAGPACPASLCSCHLLAPPHVPDSFRINPHQVVPARYTWPQLPWASPDPSAATEAPPPNLTYVAFANLPQTGQSQRIGPCHQRPQPSRVTGQVAERHQNILSSCYVLVYTISISPWHHHSPLLQYLKMFSPSSYIKTLQRSHDPPPPKQDRAPPRKAVGDPPVHNKILQNSWDGGSKGNISLLPSLYRWGKQGPAKGMAQTESSVLLCSNRARARQDS